VTATDLSMSKTGEPWITTTDGSSGIEENIVDDEYSSNIEKPPVNQVSTKDVPKLTFTREELVGAV